jgi:hypothetical protein
VKKKKYSFDLMYELDTTVGCAVAAYLDAEHYVYLHSRYSPIYEPVERDGRRIKIRQEWRLGGLRVGQTLWTEYEPPARFINYGITSFPAWLPSIHHVMSTRTDLRYYPTTDGKATVSHLRVDLEMPAWLYPFRKLIEKKICELKKEKDREDIDMILRRAKLFGRGNINSYLQDHQFMLHKDDFVKHFGGAGAAADATAAE